MLFCSFTLNCIIDCKQDLQIRTHWNIGYQSMPSQYQSAVIVKQILFIYDSNQYTKTILITKEKTNTKYNLLVTTYWYVPKHK